MKFNEIFSILQQFSLASNHLSNSKFHKQLQSFFTKEYLRKDLSFIYMILEECSIDLKNKIVIDAGCGLGQRSILFALIGARKV